MSIIILEPKTGDIGDFQVRRVLPSPRRRMVGPFIFWDEMGPAQFAPGKGLDVRPHPHIGLATITYLFDGEIEHRDTLGVIETIRPGDVNVMAAGRGIAHSERTGAELRAAGHRLHGIQAWIALPADLEEMEPRFEHQDADALPRIEQDGVRLTLIAGSGFGHQAPTHVYSPILYADAVMAADSRLDVPADHEERAAYVVEGDVAVSGETVPARTMVVFGAGEMTTLSTRTDARVMLLGGTPLGQRFINWNFVSSTRERIEKARADWRASAQGGFDDTYFALPPGEHEHIPFPGDQDGPPDSDADCPTS